MIDVVLLRIIKYRQEYVKLVHNVPMAAVDPKTQALIQDFGKYFKKFPEHDMIDMQVFLPAFKRWHPTLSDEQFSAYKGVLRNIAQDVDESTKQGIVGELCELNLATNVLNAIDKFEKGNMHESLSDFISAAVDEYKMNIGAKAVMWNDTDIGELLQEDLDNSGIKWRLDALNESMRPLRPGDFGIIAGRPDKGKTTFLSSEITFMAAQLPEDKNVIWLNNESLSGRIVKRNYQAALGKSIPELVNLSKEGKLKKMYEKVVGRRDRIRVIDIHNYHVGQVEAILENSNPGIVVYDMIDNIHGFVGESRTDQQLEEMYKWARNLAVKYNCICLATSQISVEGDGLQFPGLSMLKDSKTGKQGACDFQLMIGAVNDPLLAGSRWLGLPKNKLRRDGAAADPRAEVQFLPHIARYKDVANGS